MAKDPSRSPAGPATATPPGTLWSRRDAAVKAAWAVIAGGAVAACAAVGKALVPAVRPAREGRVVIGRPEDFAPGEVNERWKKSHRFIVVRTETGIYALRSVCTHLGCIPGWQASQDKFKCFCHGSGFKLDGSNFEGPAPRPLERLAMSVDGRGRLVVDTDIRLRAERGDWKRADAFLHLPVVGKEQG